MMQIVSSHVRADSGTFCIFLADHYSLFYHSIIKQGPKPGSKHRFSSVHTSGRFLLSFIRKKCQQTELFIVRARPPPSQIKFSHSNLINEVFSIEQVLDFVRNLNAFVREYINLLKPLIPDSRPEVIRASVEASLRRMGTDHIDLYYQHRLDPKIPIEEVAGVMSDLICEGKITHWGLSEATQEAIRRAHAICPVTAIQNRYSMMARWYEELFPVLEELHIGYVAFSPLANGFLSGKYDKHSRFEAGTDYRSVMPQFQPENIDRNRGLLELLNHLAQEKNAAPAQISLAWMLCKKPYIVPIPGTRKFGRLTENAGASEILLSAEEVGSIDKALDSMEMSQVFGGSPIVKK